VFCGQNSQSQDEGSLPLSFRYCGKELFSRCVFDNITSRYLEVEDFYYDLPDEQIAVYPVEKRDHSRLLMLNQGCITTHRFDDLCGLLPQRSMLLLNDTAVFNARLRAYTSKEMEDEGYMEVFLLSYPQCSQWNRCLAKPAKKLIKHKDIYFIAGLRATIRLHASCEFCEVFFHCDDPVYLDGWLAKYGVVPLPPYMKRTPIKEDSFRYQTTYANSLRARQSSAAPTAGLHFSKELLAALKSCGMSYEYVRLHVGGGTFLPVRTSKPCHHRMHTEKYMITEDVLGKIFDHKEKGYPVIAVGTTTFRALESLGKQADWQQDRALSFCGRYCDSDLFVYPSTTLERYKPWLLDGLITNFHAPRSTLLMLISALIGYKQSCEVYDYALREDYRFLSYGDSSLLCW